jgi:hypothetical protein
VSQSLQQFGLRLPLISGDVWAGLAKVAPLLVTAIPLGIYNFTEAMNNVESASAAGDNYNLRKVLLADGLGALIGSLLGSPFPPAVYIGHPGWKSVGGRIGYSLATGRDRAAVLPRPDGVPARADPGGGDPADPALHRPADRRAGVPGRRRVCTRRRWWLALIPNIAAVGQDPDRRRAQRRRHLGGPGRAWTSSPAPACSTRGSNRSAAARCWRAWCWARWRCTSSTTSSTALRSGRLPGRRWRISA